uniref:AB hydrolase-1 domain-containing protein n=1 Tax=Panagrolaimus sp. ES5 TaxID=591445 RepID=A0AC34GRS4_9BILA
MANQVVTINSKFLHLIGWDRFCIDKLVTAEKILYANVQEKVKFRHVPIELGHSSIYTVSLAEEKFPTKTPFVILHGIGGSSGFWATNFDELAKYRPVHAIDLLGFGRSSRLPLSSNPVIAESEWIQSIEEWRKAMKIDKMILIGHSLGGYLAAAYALKYSKNMQHLILIEPWGFDKKPELLQPGIMPWWRNLFKNIVYPCIVLSLIRISGPFANSFLREQFPDLPRRHQIPASDSDSVYEYFYQINAQKPTGENAFKTLSEFGYAKNPIIQRIEKLDSNLPITFIYGDLSACKSSIGFEVKEMRSKSYVDVNVVKGVGHHPHIDKKEDFNVLMEKIDNFIEERKNL